MKKWQDVQEGTWSFGRSQVRIPAWFKELKSDLPFPDGASLPRDVPDEGVAQDPEVWAAKAGEAAQVVQRLQRFPPALSRQGSQSEIKHGSFAQGKIVTTFNSLKIFFKWANPGLFFIYFCLFKHALQFYNKYMWKMSIQYTVAGFELTTFGTWVWTHRACWWPHPSCW